MADRQHTVDLASDHRSAARRRTFRPELLVGGAGWRCSGLPRCDALVLLGWTFAFFFHLLCGLRHLLWDIGLGFGRSERRASGWLAAAGACALTVGVWSLLWHFERL